MILFAFYIKLLHNLVRMLSVSSMGKCLFRPGSIQPLFELSHLLHWPLAHNLEKTENFLRTTRISGFDWSVCVDKISIGLCLQCGSIRTQ